MLIYVHMTHVIGSGGGGAGESVCACFDLNTFHQCGVNLYKRDQR